MASDWRSTIFAIIFALSMGGEVLAQETAPQPEYKLKAFFLYNFAVYTEWPSLPAEAIDFCILGKDPFGFWLDEIEHKTAQKRAIHIRRLGENADTKGCHLLFVPATEKDAYHRLAATIAQQATLTVTDAQQMDEKWPMIMITMIPEGTRFTFDINQSAAKTAGLSFSSKLLRLARKVK
ncbi:MAG: YfiR family protein [Undibacterium sp.]|jgi:hypothetical protein|nr:YfiR family protein [Undibacterium sp.]